VREELPTAQIVVDRFHVAENYHRTADGLRKQELKRLRKELPPVEYQSQQYSILSE
jgi:transposase